MSKNTLMPPIFLLGNVRSGTSVTQSAFGLHPNLCTWYEPRTVWMYADPSRKHDHFDASDATPRVKQYIRKRFLNHQRKHGGLRVMEKTPSNTVRARYVHEIFPESKIVYIVREPLANLSSSEYWWSKVITFEHLMERLVEAPKSQLHHYVGRLVADNYRKRVLKETHAQVWGVRYPGIQEDVARLTTEQVIAKQWVNCVRTAAQDIAELPEGRVMKIRYEDFVENPVGVFEGVMKHTGEKMTREIADWLDKNIDAGRQTKWHRLDRGVVSRVIPILERAMADENYRVPGEEKRCLVEA